ncbi:integrase catalytic domain-containing protein [Trichonephila clavipes]|uniref:Integrase catalytic domain-containing protein n=1 Tax=Trichonephila clavipes TaxID=2585209 RepID=A0A8X6W811_TRICX|nr:integrase catalytic domain-containing protein [Trichonephila clavipes]
MLTTSSLHVRNVSIKELWELDVLGITDPLLNENTKENFELTDFKNKMKILPDGRYEVKLPWKCNSENLPSNKELTWKRHLRMMNKLRNGKFFEDYKNVSDNDNILRVKSKITERNDESSFLYPILLPDKCEFTKLLIRSIHKKNCHAGIQIMQSLIRERFWIIRARKTIKSILNECFVCARFKVKSLSSGPSPLPPDRVNDCAIFEVVGIDLAGPLFLKTGEKVWITLFTCAVYRALHLELVNALSSDAFLLALRRFIARRGRPRIIYCDNGTNFRGAFNDLAKLDWHKISRETSTQKKNSLEIYTTHRRMVGRLVGKVGSHYQGTIETFSWKINIVL